MLSNTSFINYAQPQHGSHAHENRKFIMASNQLFAFCVFLLDLHPE